jgi:hypothetical protein
MPISRPLLTVAAIALTFQGFAGSAKAADPIGTLECNVSGGVGFVITSEKALACTFLPQRGAPEHYVGTIRRFGLDIGITGPGRLVWGVLGADSRPSHFPLAGEYAGATGEVSAGLGVGANALIGGNNRSIVLQPVSVNVQSGVDLAAGVADLKLEPAQ